VIDDTIKADKPKTTAHLQDGAAIGRDVCMGERKIMKREGEGRTYA